MVGWCAGSSIQLGFEVVFLIFFQYNIDDIG